MKKILNFVKNNVFLILAAYWFIDFVIGLITLKPSTLDETTRRIKALELGLALLWTLVFTIQHSLIKVHEILSEKIDLVNKRVDIICDAITEAINASKEEKNEDENGKEKQS